MININKKILYIEVIQYSYIIIIKLLKKFIINFFY